MKAHPRMIAVFMVLCMLAGLQGALSEASYEAPPAPQLQFAGDTIRPAQEAVAEILAIQRKTYSPLQEAIEAWLFAHIVPSEEGGFLVALPDFSNTKRGDLPAYAGEYPADYLPALAAGLKARMQAVSTKETIAVDATGEAVGLEAAITQTLDAANAWLAKLLTDTKAYQALTRMALDHGGEAAVWKQISMTVDAQRPRFSDEGLRKTIGGSWSGARVREAEEALIARGYLSGNPTGQYSESLADVVRRFEYDHDLPEDGKLDDFDLRILYDESMPWTLPQAFAVQEDVSDEPMDLWWDTYLHCLVNIRWEGATLRFTDMSATVDMDSLYDTITQRYANGAFLYESIADEMAAHALQMAASSLPMASQYEEAVLHLDLDALADGDFANMFLDGGYYSEIEGPGFTFCLDMDDVLWDAQDYAEENPVAAPMPNTGAITKPPSGGSTLKYKNHSDQAIFIRIYAAEDEWDMSGEELLGTLFVAPKKTGSVSMRPGYAYLAYAWGDTWYGEELMFGDDGIYTYDYETVKLLNNYIHTIWHGEESD